MDYTDYVRGLQAAYPDLAREFSYCRSVNDVLDWMQRHGLARTAVDMVGQDEFNYDFLIDLGREGRWLAFGVD